MIITSGILSCSDTIKGRVSVKGNEPHTYLALTVDKIEFRVVGPLMNEIREKYQNKYLKVKGRIVKNAIGPGFPAELEVISIVNVSSEP